MSDHRLVATAGANMDRLSRETYKSWCNALLQRLLANSKPAHEIKPLTGICATTRRQK